MKRIKIDLSKIKPLSEASHAKGINGRKISATNPSEWAWSMAVSLYPRNHGFTEEEFRKAMCEAVAYEAMSEMVDRNEAFLTLDDNNNVVIGLYE